MSIENDVLWVIARANSEFGIEKISPILAIGWVNLIRRCNGRSILNENQVLDSFVRLKNKGFIIELELFPHDKFFKHFSINKEKSYKYLHEKNKHYIKIHNIKYFA